MLRVIFLLITNKFKLLLLLFLTIFVFIQYSQAGSKLFQLIFSDWGRAVLATEEGVHLSRKLIQRQPSLVRSTTDASRRLLSYEEAAEITSALQNNQVVSRALEHRFESILREFETQFGRQKNLNKALAAKEFQLLEQLTQKYFILDNSARIRFLPVQQSIQSLTKSTEKFLSQSQGKHTWSVILSKEALGTLEKIPPTQVEKLNLWIQRIKQEGLIKTQQYPGYRDHTLHNRGHEKWAGHRSVSLNKENTRVIYKILPATEGSNRKIKVIKILTHHNY